MTLRIVVTGRQGQVVSALRALGSPDVAVVTLGRPELDLTAPGDLYAVFRDATPDIIVNAAAYTAVDKAESEPDVAMAVNGLGAGAVARAAAALGVPVIQISTDYVFDGAGDRPYVESDPTGPVGIYGASKLAGEEAVAAATEDHAILRTSWVYAAEGQNFVRTMLRLAGSRDELRVVADQRGAPTSAADIADAVLAVARNLQVRKDDRSIRGIFHMTARGETDWAKFAAEIFRLSAERGGPAARIVPITTAEYPTPARRPANSRLDTRKLEARHGVVLPDWRDGLRTVMDKLVP